MKGWPGESKLNIPFNEVIAYDAAAVHDGQPIANVIFDFGNVLVDWDPQALFMPRYSERRLSMPECRFRRSPNRHVIVPLCG